MSDHMTLGDLRRLMIRVEDQDDSVPVRVAIAVPGLTVDLGRFPTGPAPKPVVAGGPATTWRVGQAEGYHPGFGPARFILIEGVAGR